MKSRTLASINRGIIAVVVTLAIGQAAVTAQDKEPVERTLEGVWRVTFTPYNCATGVPIPPAVFEGLFTFHKDGTMSVWTNNNVITVTRTPGHGLWRREQGWNEYSTKYVNLHYNLTTGAFSGRQEAAGTLVLGESGDEYTSSNVTTVFFANGNPPATGCSTAVGVRFE